MLERILAVELALFRFLETAQLVTEGMRQNLTRQRLGVLDLTFELHWADQFRCSTHARGDQYLVRQSVVAKLMSEEIERRS